SRVHGRAEQRNPGFITTGKINDAVAQELHLGLWVDDVFRHPDASFIKIKLVRRTKRPLIAGLGKKIEFSTSKTRMRLPPDGDGGLCAKIVRRLWCRSNGCQFGLRRDRIPGLSQLGFSQT